jgi:hypothetical protein
MLDRAPLALVLDDVQWLDEPTRRVLAFVVPRLASCPLAVVAALRGVDEDLAAPVVPEPRTVIRVGPLPAAAIADIVARRTGRVPSPIRAGELHRLSGGNPYLAVEIARVAAALPPGVGDLPVPARFRSVLGARLSGLSDGCRRVLLAAALLSRPTVTILDRFGSGGWLVEAEDPASCDTGASTSSSTIRCSPPRAGNSRARPAYGSCTRYWPMSSRTPWSEHGISRSPRRESTTGWRRRSRPPPRKPVPEPLSPRPPNWPGTPCG